MQLKAHVPRGDGALYLYKAIGHRAYISLIKGIVIAAICPGPSCDNPHHMKYWHLYNTASKRTNIM